MRLDLKRLMLANIQFKSEISDRVMEKGGYDFGRRFQMQLNEKVI